VLEHTHAPTPGVAGFQVFLRGRFWVFGDTSTTADQDAFSREIELSNRRPYKHVLGIIDYGAAEDIAGRPYYYYASPFIEGPELRPFLDELSEAAQPPAPLASRDAAHDAFLSLVDDALSGIAELQDAGVAHMDVKPRNMMVLPGRFEGTPQLFHIDLGAARHIGGQGSVPLQCTKYYFPLDRQGDLGAHHTNGEATYLSQEKLAQHWKKIDLYCLGRSLEEILLDRGKRTNLPARFEVTDPVAEVAKEQRWRVILEDDFDVLVGLIDRLLSWDAPFLDARDARFAFRSLPRRDSRSIFHSVILTDPYPGLKIRVGREIVRVSRPLDAVVDHPVFQRLRRLQQLAMTSEIFPHGTHTRFAHSLLSFDMAKQFIHALGRHQRFRLIVDRHDAELILAAALVHDIGQYPFSHTIEDLKKVADLESTGVGRRHEAMRDLEALGPNHPRRLAMARLKAIRHDQDLAGEMLRMKHVFDRADERRSIAEILEDSGMRVDEVHYLFKKGAKEYNRPSLRDALHLGRDVVSGVIDVDRTSYLLMDSERTGVPFGGCVDVGSLLDSLTVREDPRDPDDRISLAVSESGAGAVESLLASTYWMYRHVYWRHTNRAFMAAVKFVMGELLWNGRLTFEEYIAKVIGGSEWDALRFLDDTYLEWLIASRGREEASRTTRPFESLLRLERLGYKRVLTIRRDDEGPASGIWLALKEGVTFDREQRLRSSLAKKLGGLANGEVLVDIPLKARHAKPTGATRLEATSEPGTQPTLWVQTRQRRSTRPWEDFYTWSHLAENMADIEEASARNARVFVARRALGRPGVASLEAMGPTILEVLRSEVASWN
ncbi:MAG: HD domain-containing protein, partial [Vicinamibacteria bacterium]|nr:HD domain-containing protein [Vicinamibacteria bacterium]